MKALRHRSCKVSSAVVGNFYAPCKHGGEMQIYPKLVVEGEKNLVNYTSHKNVLGNITPQPKHFFLHTQESNSIVVLCYFNFLGCG